MYTYFDMKEACACNICNWWSHLLPSMNYINTECIDCISSNVITINSRYKHFTFVIIHKKTTNHFVCIFVQILFFFVLQMVILEMCINLLQSVITVSFAPHFKLLNFFLLFDFLYWSVATITSIWIGKNLQWN